MKFENDINLCPSFPSKFTSWEVRNNMDEPFILFFLNERMQFRMNKMHIKVLAVLKDVKSSFKIHCKLTPHFKITYNWFFFFWTIPNNSHQKTFPGIVFSKIFWTCFDCQIIIPTYIFPRLTLDPSCLFWRMSDFNGIIGIFSEMSFKSEKVIKVYWL